MLSNYPNDFVSKPPKNPIPLSPSSKTTVSPFTTYNPSFSRILSFLSLTPSNQFYQSFNF
jgi:hypothetical protein